MRPIRILAFASAVVATVHGTSAAAQSAAERLTWHGYLTQGYGVSSPVPILGLNRDPSGDYRAAALQLRYAMSPADNFVVQAATRSMGTSPYSSSSSGSVSVDWAFYQHQFEHASVQVGRIPVPFGFLSETREVGTLLPFYRAPSGYYLESFRSLDGAIASNSLGLLGGSLESSLFAGGTEGRQIVWLPTGSPVPFVNAKLRFERVIGTELKYTTPIEGIRVRAGYATVRALDTAKVQVAPATTLSLLSAGVDASFDRFAARGESRRMKIGSNQRTYNYYAQTGVRLLSRLWLNGQGDFTTVENMTAAGPVSGMTADDRALGLSYTFATNLVGKLEKHWAHGGIDGFVAPGASPPFASYAIASLSVSF
jgi:hypothetical protein